MTSADVANWVMCMFACGLGLGVFFEFGRTRR